MCLICCCPPSIIVSATNSCESPVAPHSLAMTHIQATQSTEPATEHQLLPATSELWGTDILLSTPLNTKSPRTTLTNPQMDHKNKHMQYYYTDIPPPAPTATTEQQSCEDSTRFLLHNTFFGAGFGVGAKLCLSQPPSCVTEAGFD